ncbi:hypothetical protein [Microbispora hainanensis]|uniref:Uncharacterized protein n=1 Tax=Microbispora hainanensis TaxID=568844 RepID=A0A544Z303_9ACTN|nr:hypothetical protein [Microbispora hainanensis]TQS23439.1 hypothetical protein FLX08_02950 [Microbispora hainanensis]
MAFDSATHGQVKPGFVPEIYSANLQVRLEGMLVLASALVANRDFEGEISNQGDTVHVPLEILDPTITPHHMQNGLGTPEELGLTDTDIKITEADGFNFRVEDIAAVQNAVKGLVAKVQERAARKLAEKADLLGVKPDHHGGGHRRPARQDRHEDRAGRRPGALKAYETIVAANLVLDN